MARKITRYPTLYSALTSFPFIEDDLDKLTEYQILQGLTEKINAIIDLINDGLKDIIGELFANASYDEATRTITFNLEVE